MPSRRLLVHLLLVLLAAFLLLPAVAAGAQAPPTQPPPANQTQTVPGTAAAPPASQKQVQGYTLTPEQYERAVAYSRARYRLYFASFFYGIGILLLILVLKLSPRFRDWAEAASRRRFVQVIIYAPLLLLTLAVLGLPIDIYGQWLQRVYDQSVQGWGSWFWDWTKAQIIGLILGTLLIWILFGVIRRSPRRWWFYAWLAILPVLLLVQFIAPLVIMPLFFKFTPLQKTQPELVAQLEKVVQRGGLSIPPERMFEMNASSKLKAVNAYVTGFGASKRVVVYDTTLAKATIPETLFVFGHEMGHYVLGHVFKLIAFSAGVLLLFLYLGYHCLQWSLRRWGEGWQLRGAEDWAALPVLLLWLSVFGFLFSPASNGFARHYEHQADIYGLEVIHGLGPNASQAAAGAFQVLGETNLNDPHPSAFIKFWLYSHPPLDERIRFARSYDPWDKGEQPKFVH